MALPFTPKLTRMVLCMLVVAGAVLGNNNHTLLPEVLPPWLINHPSFSQTGQLKPTANIEAFQSLPPVPDGATPANRGWDNEAYDGLHKFFWGQEDGIIIEMGALDGQAFSVSHDFLQYHWHRILIEATPKWFDSAKERSSDATYIGAAICNSDSKIHYLARPMTDNAINGIAEFMAPKFMEAMHPNVYAQAMKTGTYDLSQVDWTMFLKDQVTHHADSIVHIIHCVRLNRVLEIVNVKKVNLFVLDIEGGELEVLRSIDFTRIAFDVLCIEVEAKNRPPNYRQDIQQLLEPYGYEFLFEKGRNAWFKAKSFQPFVAN